MMDRDDATADPVPGPPIDGDRTSSTPPFRQRARQRLGLSQRQWEYAVAGAIVIPYVVAIAAYTNFGVSEQLFLLITGAYSLLAMYGSYKL